MIKHAGTYSVEERPNMKGGPGTVIQESFFSKSDFGGGQRVRVCSKLILPPGAGIGLHAHETEDEVYIVLKGKGEVNDNGTIAEITVGDSVLTGKGASHSVRCIGSEPLEILAVVVTY